MFKVGTSFDNILNKYSLSKVAVLVYLVVYILELHIFQLIITVQKFQWLVERSAIKLLILIRHKGKPISEVHRNFNANITLVALFEILFRSFFFDVENRRHCNEVMAIPWNLLWQICSIEMLLVCITIGIS